jgi:hypothetical protein
VSLALKKDASQVLGDIVTPENASKVVFMPVQVVEWAADSAGFGSNRPRCSQLLY